TDPDQTVLLKPEPDYDLLKKLIIEKFKGVRVSIEQIEEFVLTETPFRETHYKRHILKSMEEVKKLLVIDEIKRRKGTYRSGTIIKFL
ncbi:MAG: hypothetical protein KAW92_07550, partial [Candidatus Cloacimonetes bacterium]|nr:hypothetical protein [Candidatus Cloacimonadota bacterium]